MKKIASVILLLNLILFISLESSAQCFDVITIDSVIDDRVDSNKVTINFTFTPTTSHGQLNMLVNLPSGYTVQSITPASYPQGSPTSGALVIDASAAAFCEEFVYGLKPDFIEYCEQLDTVASCLPCPVLEVVNTIEGCQICVDVLARIPGTSPAIYVDINDDATSAWSFSTGDQFVDVSRACIDAPPNSTTVNLTLSYIYDDGVCTGTNIAIYNFDVTASCACEECENGFAPKPSKKYVLSAWVKEENTEGVVTYTNANISFNFKNSSGGATTLGPFMAKGDIIDGWQRIEQEFTVPANATKIKVELNNTASSGDVFFDDIRIHPFDANMKSFVYDPVTLRLSAELDERNYATYYEYDEEGALIRVKKETARGIMTIQESRNATKKGQ